MKYTLTYENFNYNQFLYPFYSDKDMKFVKKKVQDELGKEFSFYFLFLKKNELTTSLIKNGNTILHTAFVGTIDNPSGETEVEGTKDVRQYCNVDRFFDDEVNSLMYFQIKREDLPLSPELVYNFYIELYKKENDDYAAQTLVNFLLKKYKRENEEYWAKRIHENPVLINYLKEGFSNKNLIAKELLSNKSGLI